MSQRRYNKTPRNLWRVPSFRLAGVPPLSPSTLLLYLLTRDRPTCVAGLLDCGPGAIADDTGWDVDGIKTALRDLHRIGAAVVSAEPWTIFVPAALEADTPTGDKQIKGWEAGIAEFAGCPPIDALRRHLGYPFDTLSMGYQTRPDTPSKGYQTRPDAPCIADADAEADTVPDADDENARGANESRRRWTLWRLYNHFEGRPPAGGIPSASQSPLALIVAACTDDEAQEKVDACRGRRLSYFLACFDDAGRPKPRPGGAAGYVNTDAMPTEELAALIRAEQLAAGRETPEQARARKTAEDEASWADWQANRQGRAG